MQRALPAQPGPAGTPATGKRQDRHQPVHHGRFTRPLQTPAASRRRGFLLPAGTVRPVVSALGQSPPPASELLSRPRSPWVLQPAASSQQASFSASTQHPFPGTGHNQAGAGQSGFVRLVGGQMMAGESFTAFLLGAFVSLLTIMNPPATLPIFTSVTVGMDADTTRRTATKTSVYCFCILVGSLFVGSIIMKAFGISYGAMRVAGGMIIGLLGHGMLYGKAEVSEVAKAQYANPAFFPLALPGITGPGSIAVVIGLETQIRELGGFQHRIGAYAAVLIAMLMVCAIEWLLLRSARSVTTRLGNTGIEVVTRLSGFLLICVGVQFVASGAQTLYATLVQAAAAAH